jgi:hypothetical protein
MARALTISLFLLGWSLTGCFWPKPTSGPPAPVANVDAMELSASPTAMNWDDKPGPDGIEVVLMCYQIPNSQPVPVTVAGTMEFQLFEGVVAPEKLSEARPFHVWTFQSWEMNRPGVLSRWYGLWGYILRLGWDAHVPTTEKITVTARYLPPNGQPLYAKPVVILMVAR